MLTQSLGRGRQDPLTVKSRDFQAVKLQWETKAAAVRKDAEAARGFAVKLLALSQDPGQRRVSRHGSKAQRRCEFRSRYPKPKTLEPYAPLSILPLALFPLHLKKMPNRLLHYITPYGVMWLWIN